MDEIAPFILLTKWDEVLGPKVVQEFPSVVEVSSFLPEYNPLGFATQIFMVASSLFGSQEYQKEIVDLPVVTLGIRVRVIFDYQEVDPELVRGGRLPFMLIVGYPRTGNYKKILDKLKPDFENYLQQIIKEEKTNFTLEDFCLKISNAKFNEFTTLDDFFENLKYFSEGVLFGMITGTVLRNNIAVLNQLSFEKYLKMLIQQSYENMKLGQIYISEYFEYFYCFWIGPFAFLFKPPLRHLSDLQKMLNNLTQSLVDHLWSLTLIDPHTETVNLLLALEANPSLILDLFNLTYMSVTRKLSGLPNLIDSQLKNPEIIFYLQIQAKECLHLLDEPKNFINYLVELKNLYLENHWNGFLAAISFLMGNSHLNRFYSNGPKINIHKIISYIYSFFPDSEVIQKDTNIWIIRNCPFLQLDRKIGLFSFLRSYLLAILPRYKFRFELISPNSFNLERK